MNHTTGNKDFTNGCLRYFCCERDGKQVCKIRSNKAIAVQPFFDATMSSSVPFSFMKKDMFYGFFFPFSPICMCTCWFLCIVSLCVCAMHVCVHNSGVFLLANAFNPGLRTWTELIWSSQWAVQDHNTLCRGSFNTSASAENYREISGFTQERLRTYWTCCMFTVDIWGVHTGAHRHTLHTHFMFSPHKIIMNLPIYSYAYTQITITLVLITKPRSGNFSLFNQKLHFHSKRSHIRFFSILFILFESNFPYDHCCSLSFSL